MTAHDCLQGLLHPPQPLLVSRGGKEQIVSAPPLSRSHSPIHSQCNKASRHRRAQVSVVDTGGSYQGRTPALPLRQDNELSAHPTGPLLGPFGKNKGNLNKPPTALICEGKGTKSSLSCLPSLVAASGVIRRIFNPLGIEEDVGEYVPQHRSNT